jgi:putative DNA primase/helicase
MSPFSGAAASAAKLAGTYVPPRNLALLNIIWDGGELPFGRRTSESFTVRGVRLAMALQVQEATLRAFFDRSDGLPRGIGFLARCLVSLPESTQGLRPFSEAPATWPALEVFNRRIGATLGEVVPNNSTVKSRRELLTVVRALSG